MTTMRWCSDCEADEVFEQPEGLNEPEAFCVGCGGAVFLWVQFPTADFTSADFSVGRYPAASMMTPARVVATPAA